MTSGIELHWIIVVQGRISEESEEITFSKEVDEEEESEEESDVGFYRYNQHNYEYGAQSDDGNNSKERKNKFVVRNHVRTAVSNPGKI